MWKKKSQNQFLQFLSIGVQILTCRKTQMSLMYKLTYQSEYKLYLFFVMCELYISLNLNFYCKLNRQQAIKSLVQLTDFKGRKQQFSYTCP